MVEEIQHDCFSVVQRIQDEIRYLIQSSYSKEKKMMREYERFQLVTPIHIQTIVSFRNRFR